MTHRVDALDALFVGLSVLGSLGVVWILLALFLTLTWRRPSVFVLVAAGVVTADLVALGAKLLFGRARPYVEQPSPEPLLSTPLDLSFPSGHAATAFAGATLLAAFLPRFAVPLYLLAGAVAWSRVYVGVHYPLDVFVGAALGIAVGAIFVAVKRNRARESASPPEAGPRALRWPGGGRPR